MPGLHCHPSRRCCLWLRWDLGAGRGKAFSYECLFVLGKICFLLKLNEILCKICTLNILKGHSGLFPLNVAITVLWSLLFKTFSLQWCKQQQQFYKKIK